MGISQTIILKQNRRLVAASLTGISPRPMLMGAPHDALRASNAGVSLRVPVVMANRTPPCFRTTPVSLPPHGRSWRALFSGSYRHERTCLLYDTRSAFFKEHGHIDPQPKSIRLTAAASLYKTHNGSARGIRRRCGRRGLNRVELTCGEKRLPYQ